VQSRPGIRGVAIQEPQKGICNLDAREGEATEFTAMLIALCDLGSGPELDDEARADALE
jgi:hypothetical protein